MAAAACSSAGVDALRNARDSRLVGRDPFLRREGASFSTSHRLPPHGPGATHARRLADLSERLQPWEPAGSPARIPMRILARDPDVSDPRTDVLRVWDVGPFGNVLGYLKRSE